MPPHCDSLDGPVVVAARHALDADDVDLVLPFVPVDGEKEVSRSSWHVRPAPRALRPARSPTCTASTQPCGCTAAARARRTPASSPPGWNVGPVIPLAEQAVDTGDPGPLIAFLQREVAEQARRRLGHVRELQAGAAGEVPAGRTYTSAMLGFLVWSHKLWRQTAQAHDH